MATSTPTPRSRGRPARLSRGAVIGAALALVDEQGLEGLNIRALADRLSSSPMALYHHLSNKSALLDGMLEAVLDEIEVPNTKEPDPIEQAKVIARSFRGALLAHPKVLPLFVRGGPSGSKPAQLRPTEAALAAAYQAGLRGRMALQAYTVVLAYVTGYVIREAASMPLAGYGREGVDDLRKRLENLDREEFPRLKDVAGELQDEDPEALFELGLDALLTGLVLGLGSNENTPQR